MAVPPAKTFKLKTRTNMQISPQTKAGFAQQQQPAAPGSPVPPPPAPPPAAKPQENLTGKPVFVPYQHIPPAQQAKPVAAPQQQGIKTQHAPIQGKLLQRRPTPPPAPGIPQAQPQAVPPPQGQQASQVSEAQSMGVLRQPQYQQQLVNSPQVQQDVSPEEYQHHHENSPYTPPVSNAINPEASIKEISLNPVAAPFVQQQRSSPAQKTSAMPTVDGEGKVSDELKKILENEAENYKDQVQAYVDVCDILSKPGWKLADIVDYIHMLVRSVNLDVVSIVVIDPAEKKKFMPVASRGFKSSPSAHVVSCWLPAISDDNTIIWDELLEAALDKKNKLAKWIVKENLNYVGYVPLHDNKKIYGFLFVAVSGDEKTPSALASPLLELCGGRIGLVLESRRSVTTVPDEAVQAAKLLKDHLSMLSSYLEILKITGKVNPEDVANITEKCLSTLNESRKLVDRFADSVSSSSTAEKKG